MAQEYSVASLRNSIGYLSVDGDVSINFSSISVFDKRLKDYLCINSPYGHTMTCTTAAISLRKKGQPIQAQTWGGS